MAEYDESEYFSDTEEEIAEREAQEALRRMVRTEIRRVQSGAAKEDIAKDEAEEERQKEVEKRSQKRAKWLRIITGDILLAKEVQRVYILLTLLGAIFFASIMTIFAALKQDLRSNKLQKEIELLKERAIRTSERCYQCTSHSAISNRLKERGIKIEDPKQQPKVLR